MTTSSAFVLLLMTGLATSTVHQNSFNAGKVAHSKDDAYYDFRYAVDDGKSGVVADRWESRSGRFVKGAYSLLGPDGKVRSVHYEVDGDHGFKAVVRTDTSSLNLLSTESDRQIRLTHGDPPINQPGLVDPPPPPPLQLPPGGKLYNYHARPARPERLRQRSQSVPLGPIPIPTPTSLFSNDLLHRPSYTDERLQALEQLTPPAIDAFSRTYDSYPRPVRTNPNRRHEEPVQDVHRTVYSDYVNKQLQRFSPLQPQRAARLARLPVGVAPSPLAPPLVAPLKRSAPVSLEPVPQPAPFSRHRSRPRQFLTETSPYSSSYFL